MNQKNLLFITSQTIDHSSGIGKKIISQFSAFRENGVNAYITHLEVDANNKYSCRIFSNNEKEMFKNGIFIKRSWRWYFEYKSLFKFVMEKNIELIYIRYTHFASPQFLLFLRKLKKAGRKILIEIPTFPYDKEYKNLNTPKKIINFTEKICRNFFRYYTDRIITFSDEELIFNIPTIKINNGIDLKNTPRKNKIPHTGINLIAVAMFEPWHGYDRLIEGLKNYYQNNKNEIIVKIKFVGPINETSKEYKRLVEKHELQNYIEFYGKLNGDELDRVFNESDIAIGCLGVHRKGITKIKSLKNVEYCARGFPFVYSESDESFDNSKFIYRAPSDESPIDINQIIKLFNLSDSSLDELRQYAIKELTWSKQIKTIIREIDRI